MIKGQEKICTFIDNCTLSTLPKTLLLVGEEGSGKHTLCKYVGEKFNLIVIDISDKLTQEIIEEITFRVEPTLYLIDGNNLSIKDQNVILKFLEEPLQHSFIVIYTENTTSLIETVMNRCHKMTLEPYSKDFLKTFTDNDLILQLANTPGQVKTYQYEDINSMIELANKILDKIHLANIPNTLTLTDKLAFKNEKGKIPYKLFIKVLNNFICKRYVENNDTKLVEAYTLTNDLMKSMNIPNVDCKYLFDCYLVKLRQIMKGSLI